MSEFSLTAEQKQLVVSRTSQYIADANIQLKLDLEDVPIKFDLKGKSSGMFVVKNKQVYIRYNEMIFSAYFDDALINTVAHEVAHYVVFSVWGLNSVKPHGREWKQVMTLLGVKAEVTSRYNVEHIPLHQQRRHEYSCACMHHLLSTTRHNKVQSSKAVYSCKKCRQPLKLLD